MAELYECSRCGVVSKSDESLCQPHERHDIHEYCGTEPERGHLCDDMREHLTYVCGECGRPANQADLVCKPLITG